MGNGEISHVLYLTEFNTAFSASINATLPSDPHELNASQSSKPREADTLVDEAPIFQQW